MVSDMKLITKIILCLLVFNGLYSCGEKRQTSLHVDVTPELQSVADLYDYSTVDWQLLDTLYYRPYNCDWSEEIGKQIHHDFPTEFVSVYWNRLQNAKTYFHQQTLPLRCNASDELIVQLNRTEAAFDSVFVSIVRREYYMRIFVDYYNEIMPKEIDNCFERMK